MLLLNFIHCDSKFMPFVKKCLKETNNLFFKTKLLKEKH